LYFPDKYAIQTTEIKYEFTIFIIFVVVVALIISSITFYQTIITKKWRNKIDTERNNWYLGIFYFNPEDTRLFLPKRTGLGFTLNFAKPVSIVLFLGILSLIILLIITQGQSL
jgi:uncharacterized membrane protein